MRPACDRRAMVVFYLSHGLVRVCGISYADKNNGYPDLGREKIIGLATKPVFGFSDQPDSSVTETS